MRSEVLTGLGLLAAIAAVGVALWPTDPNGGSPNLPLVRAQALALCGLYLPCNRGDAHYNEICKDFGGSGTTCGYLPAWMWWRMGCRIPALVNREEPADGLHYRQAQNIADVVNGGEAVGCRRAFSVTNPPEGGDVLYFQDVLFITGQTSNPREHVAVCVSYDAAAGTLTTYDLGHSPNPEGNLVTRRMHADGTVEFMGSNRRIVFIDDLTLVPLTAAADLTDHTLAVA